MAREDIESGSLFFFTRLTLIFLVLRCFYDNGSIDERKPKTIVDLDRVWKKMIVKSNVEGHYRPCFVSMTSTAS